MLRECLVAAWLALPAVGADWALTGNLGAHDPSIIREGATWWVFATGTGLPIKTSPDGLNWTEVAPRFAAELPWWRTYVPGMALLDVWAPDVHTFNGRVWCYYCVSEFGTNLSAIGLTSCSSLAGGDWRDDGLVIASAPGAQTYNALDPSLAIDASGNPWLVFGSFFDGIHVTRLDPASMKPTGPMYSLAVRANGIEASNIVYANGYYYLFVSIDKCCLGVNSTYKIAYGRSTTITGPYVDANGNPMLQGNTTVFLASGSRWIGPGGQSVVQIGAAWIVAYHAYDALNQGAPTLRISDLYWDGSALPTFTEPPPVFTAQPVAVTVGLGTSFALLAQATYADSYQWWKNGAVLPGATDPILFVAGNTAPSSDNYVCTATNVSATTTSQPAAVAAVATGDPGRLANLSCRAPVGPSPLIAGFYLGGANASASDPVLVRASGPALAAFGIGGVLPDPSLQVFPAGAGAATASDNGWGGASALEAAATQVGAFSWPVGSADSALLLALLPGGYSAVISGASGDAGMALAEVYDALPAPARTPGSTHPVNLSARTVVAAGGSSAVGFVIAGSTARTVLVRASGPALAGFGVAGVLPDPALQLWQLAAGGNVLLASQTGWNGDGAITAAAAEVAAFSWGAGPSADSAVLATLPPGSYSTEVAGAAGDGGAVLIEVYDVP